MALLKRHLYLLVTEHRKYPIKRNVLTLSQHAVFATLDEVKSLFKKEKVSLNNLPADFDTKNKIPAWHGTRYDNYTNCQTVLTLLGADKVYVSDVSNYENPDIIIDLNVPIDNKYYNKFDVILSIGALEHVFNITQAFENIKLMVKPGGTIILGTPASNAINHGFYQICPTLYYDYFKINGFENFSCFISESSGSNYEKKARIYKCKPKAMTKKLTFSSNKYIEVVFFARKSVNNNLKTKIPILPIQGVYNTSTYWQGKPGLTQPKKKNLLGEFMLYLLFISRRWRPEFIDKKWRELKTKNKLIYIGRY